MKNTPESLSEEKKEPLTIRKVVASDQVEKMHEELQLYKTKCSYYESALEKVLMFIVPDNCRGMVEQALKIGKSNFEKH